MCPGTSSEVNDADLHLCLFCEHERILSGGACSSLQFLGPLQSELAPFPSQMNPHVVTPSPLLSISGPNLQSGQRFSLSALTHQNSAYPWACLD